MTFGGIIDSLLATAIWAAIGFLFYKIRKMFKEDEALHKKLKEEVADAMNKEMDISNKLDLIFAVNIVRDKYKQIIISLYFSESILILYIFIFSADKAKIIFTVIYIILLLCIWVFSRKIKKRFNGLDMAILASVLKRIIPEAQ